jgi:hypothetical protein
MVKKSKNKFKNIKINLNISNRLLYSIIAVLVIVGIGAFVYAVTPNPGHTANEIEGVCKSNGQGCPNYQTNLNLKIENEKLCYPTSTGCHIDLTSCPNTKTENITTSGTTFSKDGECPTLAIQNQKCNDACSNKIACTGETSLTGCTGGSPTSVKYTKGVSSYTCTATTIFFPTTITTYTLNCTCSLTSAQNYNKEVSGGGAAGTYTYKCILGSS